MNEYDDRRLAALLSEAVDGIEPTESLDAIRERTRVTPITSRRPWLFAAGGAVLATAAAVTAIALATGSLSGPTADPAPAGSNTPTVSEATDPAPTGETVAAGIYYVGETPVGLRLYREFRRVPADDRLSAPLLLAGSTPLDPDYRTLWPADSFAGAGFDGIGADGFYSVELTDAGLAERPAGMTEEEAHLAVQAVVYTMQATGGARAPVEFYAPGATGPLDTVLGVPATRDPEHDGVRMYTNDPILAVNSHVQLSIPDEGQAVPVDSVLEVSGAANSNEANLLWQLQHVEDDEVVAQGNFTAAGWMGEKLFAFEGTVDLAGIPPGSYLLVVSTDDPSGGAEGFGPFTDSRSITIE